VRLDYFERDTAFIDQVNDQLQFVQAFEVRHFRPVTRFHQRCEGSLDQVDCTSAQNRLFAEQVRFGFFAKVGFDDTGTATAICCCVRQRYITSCARLVLRHGDQLRHAFALDISASRRMARCFWRNHDHVEIRARTHLTVVHVEAMCKRERRTLLDVGVYVLAVDIRDMLVRQQHHHHICMLDRFRDFLHGRAGVLGFAPGYATSPQTDSDVHATIFQVQRMSMPLRTVADSGNLPPFDQSEVDVLVVENFHVDSLVHHVSHGR
jgi:hypothetical protein